MSLPPSRPPVRIAVRRQRLRFALIWTLFGICSVGAAFALHRLHVTVQRELLERGRITLAVERAQVRERAENHARELRVSTMKELAAFHVEGLEYALREWSAKKETILGTFVWTPEKGFSPDSTFPPSVSERLEIPMLWQPFRSWRATHPTAAATGRVAVGAYETASFRLLDNSDFPPSELGYQAENLEMLTYGGGTADPWAGWAGNRDDAKMPWIIWYQAGPHAPIRGCFVDHSAIVSRLQSELSDPAVARISIIGKSSESRPTAGESSKSDAVSPWLPGYILVADYGNLFLEKQSSARLTALAAALILALFLIGVISLSAFSRRAALEAERRTTFVAQVSHELRTPLTSIRIFADMLTAPTLSEEKRTKYAGSISRESQRLGALIERLLTFSNLERRQHAPAVGRVDVAEVVRETCEEMATTLSAAGMKIETPFPTAAVTANTDRSTLKQALLNLIDNALKYAAEGGAIRFSLTTDGRIVRLQIADDGPGVAGPLGDKIFEPFVQGGETLTDKPSGVGLGLSIARGLLRAVDGDLVLLRSDRGAVFEIQLPAFQS